MPGTARAFWRGRADGPDDLLLELVEEAIERGLAFEPSMYLTGVAVERRGHRDGQAHVGDVGMILTQDPVDDHPAGAVPDQREIGERIGIVALVLHAGLEIGEELLDEEPAAVLEPSAPVPSEY